MHPRANLPLSKPEHLHPRLHRELTTIGVSVNPIYYRREPLVMDGERSWYPYTSTLVLLFLGKGTPFRTSTHKVLREDKSTVLTDELSLVEVLDQIDAAALGTN